MGHLVRRNDIKSNSQNVEKIKNTEILKNTTELKRFLEMAQYYRQYINSYANMTRLLYNMLKKDKLAV